MDYQSQQDFFAWEAASRDTIDFKTVYVDMADDLMAGLLLSQLVYWHLPTKHGTSKMRISKEGNLWVAKARTEWWAETRLKPRQVDRAAKILVKKGLVFTKKWRFNGSPTTHWRINWNAFLPSLKRESERWKKNCNSPKRELQQTKALLTNDETVTSLTETVAESTAQIDPPAPKFPIGEQQQEQVTNSEPLEPQLSIAHEPFLPEPPFDTDPATSDDEDDEGVPSMMVLAEIDRELQVLEQKYGISSGDLVDNGIGIDAPVAGGILSKPHEYMPDHVSPPGETLLEKLEELGMSQGELARRMSWREETASEVVQGKMPITPEIALRLEQVLGVPAAFWNNRERQYRQHLAQKEGHEQAQVAAEQPAPKRDYLTDLFNHARREKPGDSDTHVRPRHWESVSDAEYAICQRVALLWCGGRLPFPGSIEAHCGAAGWLLELNGGNLGATIRALDEYHRHYEAERMTFTVAGPKSLVSVLPAFLAAEGGGGEPGVIQVGG
jgi:addiction module HigA family antidote